MPVLRLLCPCSCIARACMLNRLSAARPPVAQPFPSHANFLLCRVAEGRDAKALKEALAAQHGIMVRHYR